MPTARVPLALEPLECEIKYSVPAGVVPVVAAWLAAVGRPEQPHPRSVVETIYLDTPDLRSLEQKRASELHKVKVRLRWYDGGGPVFCEVKRRHGSRRDKWRVRLPLEGERLSREGLLSPALHGLPALLGAHGVPVAPTVRPVLRLRYHRARYHEPASGARLALDTGIAATATVPPLGPADPRPLPWAVLELKGAVRGLPPALAALARLGCRRAAVSKYAAVLLGREEAA